MRIQIHIVNDFCKTYMPFLLFRDCVYHILKEHYCQDNDIMIEYIYDIASIHNDAQTIVLLNIYDITLYEHSQHVLDTILSSPAHFLIVNTEYWENRGAKAIFDILKDRVRQNILLVEYNIINYRSIMAHYPSLLTLFLPLIYNEHLENYYMHNIRNNRLTWHEKDIDVLFYGGLNDRRQNVLTKIGEVCNVHIVESHHGATNEGLCELIERSKVVINVLYYDYNVIFDYYRNTILLANKTLLITETPREIDQNVEYWLDNIDQCLTTGNYDNLVNITTQCLNMDDGARDAMLQRQHEWFTRVNMRDIVVPFFEYFRLQGEYYV